MYSAVIWLGIIMGTYYEIIPFHNPSLFFDTKKSCEEFVQKNYNEITLSIERQFSYEPNVKLAKVLSMECVANKYN